MASERRVERLDASTENTVDWSALLFRTQERAPSKLPPNDRATLESAMALNKVDFGSDLWAR